MHLLSFVDSLRTNSIGTTLVHHDCRRKFADTRRKSSSYVPRKKLRSSSEVSFNWKSECFLCSKKADKKNSTVYQVTTLPLRNNLITCCKSRIDDWGNTVKDRLECCIDLVAEEAVYHISCMNKFRLKTYSENKRGRPADLSMLEGFSKVCEWLENDADGDLYTLKEVHNKMSELNGDAPCYTIKSLKYKLKEHYGENLYFAELPGRPNLVCFKDMANFILNDLKKNSIRTSNDVIVAAAKIIKADDIRQMENSMEEYPSIESLDCIEYAKVWVPESLQIFLNHIISSELKRISIGQCISQASRPRSTIVSIPFGIGVDLDKSFGSKWLINHLSKFGFSITADEVVRFKESAIKSLDSMPTEDNNHFTHWVADNVDHSIATLTGKNTFHGMGIISISSSENRAMRQKHVIHRLQERTKTSSCVSQYGIDIVPYTGSCYNGLSKLVLKPIKLLQPVHDLLPSAFLNYNLLWHSLEVC